jgi:hypothetical protein
MSGLESIYDATLPDLPQGYEILRVTDGGIFDGRLQLNQHDGGSWTLDTPRNRLLLVHLAWCRYAAARNAQPRLAARIEALT